MKWHNGSIETAMAKAEKLDAILFIYVYPENSALTKEVNELFFTPLPSGSWASSLDVVDLYNENMVSVKMTAQAARRELGNTYDLSKPIFLWMNSLNKQPIRGDVISSIILEDLDLENISREILLNEFEKTGKSHPAYEFENFKTIIENNNCDDLFCSYNIMHRIFLKMPENQKSLMYDEISYNPGEIGSAELKWLMKEDDFLNEEKEDRMEVFENALRYTYYKNTPDINSLTYDEIEEGFSKYANDNILKPLGNYAKTFKQYLIDNKEGEGFTNTVNPLLKNAKFKFEDDKNGWSLNDVKNENKYYFSHTNSGDKILLTEFNFPTESDEKLKRRNEGVAAYYLNKYGGGKITEQGFREINGIYGHRTIYDFRETKLDIELLYDFEISINSYTYNFKGTAKKYDIETIDRIEDFFNNFKFLNKENENDSKTEISDNSKTFKTIKYDNGKIKAEGNIDNKTGEKIDFWFNYNKEGKLVYTTTYTNNANYTRTFYYSNSEVSSFQIFKNKKLWRVMECFDIDGKRTLIDGNGIFKLYYPNSRQLYFTGQMKNGVRDGVANWYYKNGQLKQSVIYKYSEDENHTGLRWEVLIMFDKEGNPLNKGTLKNGNGTWNKYDEEGKLSGTSTFKNGIEVN